LQGCLNSKNYSLMESRLGKHSQKAPFLEWGTGPEAWAFCVCLERRTQFSGTPHLLRYINFICGATHFSSPTSEIDLFRTIVTLLPKASATSSVCGPAATKLYLFLRGVKAFCVALHKGRVSCDLDCCSHSQGCKLESQREQRNR